MRGYGCVCVCVCEGGDLVWDLKAPAEMEFEAFREH